MAQEPAIIKRMALHVLSSDPSESAPPHGDSVDSEAHPSTASTDNPGGPDHPGGPSSPGHPSGPDVPGTPPTGGKRGGSRPGAGRKRRTAGGPSSPPPASASAESAPSSGAAPPADPFGGGAPVVDGSAGTLNVQSLIGTVDPGALADTLIVMLDGAAKALAVRRYGPELGRTVEATAEGRREMQAALRQYLHAANVRLTPGQAVVASIAAAYMGPVMAAEMALAQARA